MATVDKKNSKKVIVSIWKGLKKPVKLQTVLFPYKIEVPTSRLVRKDMFLSLPHCTIVNTFHAVGFNEIYHPLKLSCQFSCAFCSPE
jgi:hypothetical protein